MDSGLGDHEPGVFTTASDVLGIDVLELCRTGKTAGADLASTRWAQPAVLTASVAGAEALRSSGISFTSTAGHSVGEYAALVVSGAIAFPDALRLIALRAAATADAAAAAPGGMAALLKIDDETIRDVCSSSGVSLAADNAVGQFVISGPVEQLDEAIALATQGGAKCRRLDVAGAFHSPMMAPAIESVEAAVARTDIREPEIAFWSSTTATQLTDPSDIGRALVDQLTAGVRWRDTVTNVTSTDASELIDVGPGRVVGALVKRIVPDAQIRAIADLVSVGGAA